MSSRGRESLAQIASQGGGRFIRDANDLAAGLTDILDSTSHYYLVAFEPRERKQPGELHEIEVKARPKGLRVSHRSGYREEDPAAPKAPFAQQLADSAALVKGIESSDVPFDVLAIPYRGPSGQASVPTVVTVPGSSLDLDGSGPVALDIVGYVLDAEGAVRDHVAARLKLDRGRWEDRLRSRGIQLHTAFDLPPGEHSLRLLVRDHTAGLRGIAVRQVSVPDLETTDLLLYPPVLMGDPEEWVLAPMGSQRIAQPELPFHVGGRIFVPLQRGQIDAEEQRRAVVMSFGDSEEDEAADWELRAQLLDTGGQPVALEAFGLARQTREADGMRRIELWFKPGALEGGDYALRIRMEDRETGRSAESRSVFVGGGL